MQRGAREFRTPDPTTPNSGSEAVHEASFRTDPAPRQGALEATQAARSADLLAACGVSMRQLDYAVRSGLVVAHPRHAGSGHPRYFSLTEASGLFILVRLREVANSRENLRGLVERARRGCAEVSIPLAPGMELRVDTSAVREHLLRHWPDDSPPEAPES